jgi:hypothetical protein
MAAIDEAEDLPAQAETRLRVWPIKRQKEQVQFPRPALARKPRLSSPDEPSNNRQAFSECDQEFDESGRAAARRPNSILIRLAESRGRRALYRPAEDRFESARGASIRKAKKLGL